MTGRGGSRWTELNERGVEAAHKAYRRDGLSGRAHDAQLRAALWAYVAAVFSVGEPDDERLAPARNFLYGIGHQGECALLCECGLQEARAAVAAVRASGEGSPDG